MNDLDGTEGNSPARGVGQDFTRRRAPLLLGDENITGPALKDVELAAFVSLCDDVCASLEVLQLHAVKDGEPCRPGQHLKQQIVLCRFLCRTIKQSETSLMRCELPLGCLRLCVLDISCDFLKSRLPLCGHNGTRKLHDFLFSYNMPLVSVKANKSEHAIKLAAIK